MRHISVLSLLAALFFCSTESRATYSRIDAETAGFIADTVTSFLEETGAVGLSIGVMVDGEVAFLAGYGFADRENEIPATEHTLYRLASISKSITGILAMQLVESEALDLEADIRSYVQEYPNKDHGTIRVRHLLSHQSGIIHYDGTANGQYCSDPYSRTAQSGYILVHSDRYNPIAALGIFSDQETCFEPGEHYQYTTWGFCLAGAVIERAGDESYVDQLYRRIICPLELPTLQPEFQAHRPYPNEAAGYELSGDDVISSPLSTDLIDISYKLPSGGMIGSVIDLTLVMRGIVNPELFSEETRDLFGQDQVPADGESPRYGYGISTYFRGGDRLFWHSGSQAKTATLFYFSPDNRNGVALMSNTRGVNLFPLARAVYDRLRAASLVGRTPYQIPSGYHARFHTEYSATTCEGKPYEGYSESGTYVDTLVSSFGCDSVRTLHLTVLPSSHPDCAVSGVSDDFGDGGDQRRLVPWLD